LQQRACGPAVAVFGGLLLPDFFPIFFHFSRIVSRGFSQNPTRSDQSRTSRPTVGLSGEGVVRRYFDRPPLPPRSSWPGAIGVNGDCVGDGLLGAGVGGDAGCLGWSPMAVLSECDRANEQDRCAGVENDRRCEQVGRPPHRTSTVVDGRSDQCKRRVRLGIGDAYEGFDQGFNQVDIDVAAFGALEIR